MLRYAILTALKTRRDHRYHGRHAAEADRILEDVKADGKRLSAADRKRCDDYATQVLGRKHFSPWLQVYTVIAGEFREGWIPDNFYGLKVNPAIKGEHGRISSLKSIAGALFNSQFFPDLGYQINGRLFDRAYQQITVEEAKARFFATSERVIVKNDRSGRGEGIHLIDRSNFDAATLTRIGNGVFQRYVAQHPLFDRFAASSVATIRLSTVVEPNGKIAARAAYLRLGTGHDTHVQSRSHVRIPLHVATGEFRGPALLANWRECLAHPTSNEPFAGNSIPAFSECLRAVTALHEQVRFVGAIGWDLAVDRDEGVHVLEWNGTHNDIKFSEAVSGPCFRGLGWEKLA
jgi:hypothetical protein